jgi:hypothetical protein
VLERFAEMATFEPTSGLFKGVPSTEKSANGEKGRASDDFEFRNR